MLFEVGEKILPIMQASFSAHIKGCVPCRVPLAKTCQDFPRPAWFPFHLSVSIGICRQRSFRILVVTFLYLARLSARCNGSWTWALSSGPEIWGSISSVMRCYEMFLEYIVVVISKKNFRFLLSVNGYRCTVDRRVSEEWPSSTLRSCALDADRQATLPPMGS